MVIDMGEEWWHGVMHEDDMVCSVVTTMGVWVLVTWEIREKMGMVGKMKKERKENRNRRRKKRNRGKGEGRERERCQLEWGHLVGGIVATSSGSCQ